MESPTLRTPFASPTVMYFGGGGALAAALWLHGLGAVEYESGMYRQGLVAKGTPDSSIDERTSTGGAGNAARDARLAPGCSRYGGAAYDGIDRAT